MVFIDVLAVFDGHLLAALELDGSELLARNLLSAKCDGVGGPAALLEYLVIDGEQVAGLELESWSEMTRSISELIRTFTEAPLSVISTLRLAYHTMLATNNKKAQQP